MFDAFAYTKSFARLVDGWNMIGLRKCIFKVPIHTALSPATIWSQSIHICTRASTSIMDYLLFCREGMEDFIREMCDPLSLKGPGTKIPFTCIAMGP